jgi:hypothetical protein
MLFLVSICHLDKIDQKTLESNCNSKKYLAEEEEEEERRRRRRKKKKKKKLLHRHMIENWTTFRQ